MNVGDLTVRIAADIGDLKTNVEEARGKIKEFGGAFDTAAGAIKTFIAGISVKEIIDLVVQVNDATAGLLHLSQRTGAAVEELGKLRDAAALAGSPIGDIAGALDRLAKNLTSSPDSLNKTSAALSAFGVTATDASGAFKPTAQIFDDVAKAQAGYADGVTKTGLIIEIFGKGAGELIPIMNNVADAHITATSVTTEQAKQAELLTTAINALKLSNTHLYEGIVGEIAPALTDLLTAFTDVKTQADGLSGAITALIESGAVAGWASDAAIQAAAFADAVTDEIAALKLMGGEVALVIIGIADFARAIANVVTIAQDPITSIGNIKDAYNDFKGALDAVTTEFDTPPSTKYQDALGATQIAADIAKRSNFDLRGELQKTPADTKAAADAYQKVIDKLSLEYSVAAANLAKTISGDGGLTAAERELIGIQNSADWATFSGTQQQAILDWSNVKADADLATKAYNDAQGATKDLKKYLDDLQKSRADELSNLDTQIRKQADANATYGLGSAAVVAYKLAIIDNQIAYAAGIPGEEGEIDRLEALKKKYELLKGEMAIGEALAQQKKDLEDAGKAWDTILGNINSTAEKVFVDFFEGGKKAFTNLTDLLKKTLLQALYDLTLKPFVLQIAVLATGATGSVAQAAVGGGINATNVSGGGFGGLFSTVGNGLSSISGLWGGGGAGIFGSGLGNAFATSSIGEALGLSTSVSGLAGESGAMMLTGLGTTLGAAIPVIGALVGVGLLVKNWLDSKKGGPKQAGTFGPNAFYPGETSTDNNAIAGAGVSGTLDYIRQVSGQLGVSPGDLQYSLGFDTDPQGTAQNRVSSLLTSGGATLYRNVDQNAGRDNATLQAAISTQMQEAFKAAMKASNLTQPFKDLFAQLDAALPAADFAKVVQQIVNFKHALDAFADKDLADRFATAAAVNPAAIGALTDFAVAYDRVNAALAADPKAMAMQAVADSQLTAYGSVMKLRSGLTDLLSTYDGSTAATNNLAAATAQYVQAQAQALLQIEQMKTSLGDLFGGSVRQIGLQVMSTADQINFLQNEANKAYTDLGTAIDPTTINNLGKLVNTDLMQAFNLLDAKQQAAQYQAYQMELNAAAKLVQDRLTAAGASITQTSAPGMTPQETILDKISTAVNKAAADMVAASTSISSAATSASTAADTMTTAANTMQTAAGTMNTAANVPVTVHVDLVPAGP